MRIEEVINERLVGDAQKNALDFIEYLRDNEMQFDREVGGYWDGKFYYAVRYNEQFVCFILIYSPASIIDSNEPWVVWSDDSGSKWYEDDSLDEELKEIAWKNVGTCGNETETACGGCPAVGGQPKTIFGKIFNNTCGTTFRFNNPNRIELECMKKLMDIRKNDILKNI